MKRIKILTVALTLITFSIFLLFACNKENSKENLTDNSASTHYSFSNYNLASNSCTSEIVTALNQHNVIMNDLLTNTHNFNSSDALLSYTINKSMELTNVALTSSEIEQIKGLANKYLIFDNPANESFSKMLANGIITQNEFNTLKNIDEAMSVYNDKDDVNIGAVLDKLNELQANLVDNNPNLNQSEKCKLTKFIATCYNCGVCYAPYLNAPSNDEGFTQNKKGKGCPNCGKCMKNNIWNILLGDGVGTIVGAAGCAICWPCCPVLLPALVAYGSGGSILFWCPCCVK